MSREVGTRCGCLDFCGLWSSRSCLFAGVAFRAWKQLRDGLWFEHSHGARARRRFTLARVESLIYFDLRGGPFLLVPQSGKGAVAFLWFFLAYMSAFYFYMFCYCGPTFFSWSSLHTCATGGSETEPYLCNIWYIEMHSLAKLYFVFLSLSFGGFWF